MKHLVTHLGQGGLDDIVTQARREYAESRDVDAVKMKRQSLLTQLHLVSDQDKGIYQALKLIVHHLIPISKLKDTTFTEMLKEAPVSIDVLMETMFHLTLVVEEKVSGEMKGKKGTILHDGWTRFGRHYVCLFSAFPSRVQVSLKLSFTYLIIALTLDTLGRGTYCS